MYLTVHAKQRWQERCRQFDLDQEWQTACRPGKALWKKLKASCIRYRNLTREYSGQYFLVSRNRVVFVCEQPEKVITVFRLTDQ